MSVTVTYGPESVIRFRFVGHTEIDEVVEALATAFDDPRCPDEPRILVDIRESMSVTDRKADEIRIATHHFRSSVGDSRRAILATEGIRYGLMRMASSYSALRGGGAPVFVDEAEALRFLASDSEGG